MELSALEDLLYIAEESGADLIHYNSTYLNGDAVVDLYNDDDRRALLSFGYFSCGHSMKFYKRTLIRQTGSRFAEGRAFEEPKFTYPFQFYANRILFLKNNWYKTRQRDDSTMRTTARTHIMDHPAVQLELLDFLNSRGLTDRFHDEIEEYFIWSFFYETISNILKIGMDSVEPSDLTYLRDTCNRLFPSWKENPYIKNYSSDRWEILNLLR